MVVVLGWRVVSGFRGIYRELCLVGSEESDVGRVLERVFRVLVVERALELVLLSSLRLFWVS